jgi:hypothetical protein
MTRPGEAQDLLERAQARAPAAPGRSVDVYRGRDRLDLGLSGDPAPALLGTSTGSTAQLGLRGSVDVDFACGKFDLAANLRQMFGKEAREEFMRGLLNYALSELTGSGMTLLCEASPTACQVFQHYRINANEMLKVHYDWCSAIQAGADAGLQRSQASAIKLCLDEKARQGMTLDAARDACRSANTLQGIGGIQVVNLSVLDQLARSLNLTGPDRKRLSLLVNDVNITAQGATGTIRADVLPDRFVARRQEYLGAWDAVLQAAQNDGPVPDDLLQALTPPGAPPLLSDEVRQITRLGPARQRLYTTRMASSSALLSLTLDVQWAERLLQAARKAPVMDETLKRTLESELGDLRRQLEQLRELREQQLFYNRALAELSEAGQVKAGQDAADLISRSEARRTADATARGLPRFGTFDLDPSPSTGASGNSPKQGLGCSNCPPPLSLSFGSPVR